MRGKCSLKAQKTSYLSAFLALRSRAYPAAPDVACRLHSPSRADGRSVDMRGKCHARYCDGSRGFSKPDASIGERANCHSAARGADRGGSRVLRYDGRMRGDGQPALFVDACVQKRGNGRRSLARRKSHRQLIVRRMHYGSRRIFRHVERNRAENCFLERDTEEHRQH